jgi:signal transduction histidine kinase
MAKKKVNFEASARLQRLLGRELIPNDEMAIVELVKNAYDSRARSAQILVQPESATRPSVIRITDDGSGMSEEDVRSLFMVAGYSQRLDQVNSTVRTPTGEKGIGRFAADKLGRTLDVYTKRRSADKTLHLHIDWEDFDDRLKKFNDIQATYQFINWPRFAAGGHGTVLEITGLRSEWDEGRIGAVQLGLADLLNPFSPPNDFRISLGIGNKKGVVDEVDLKPIVLQADLSMSVSIVGDKVRRLISRRGEKDPIVDEKVGSPADLAYLRGLRARFLHFDKRPTKKQTHGLDAGVRVYRDGFRIEPFGSRTADWLHIAEKRAKRAGHAHVVPSRLFGFVEISRVSNPELADTTSRQALLDTSTARNLVTVLRSQLDELGEVLKTQAEPRWQENRRKQAIEAEQARLHTLGVMSFGLAHELRQPLQSIRSEAHSIRTRLEQLGVTDQDVGEAQAAIDRGVERIDNNITLVSSIVKASVTDKLQCDLADLVRKEIDLFQPRASALGITISLKASASHPANVNKFAIYTVLINYLQNSLESLDTAKRTGKIFVTLQMKDGKHYLEVKDDGGGVAEDVRSHVFKKFATKKTGGMGVGLYYCKMIVESHGGNVGFDSKPGKGATFWMSLPEG